MENRDIRFRVFDKQTKQMSPSFTLFGEFLLIGAVHAWQYECGNTEKDSLEALEDLEVMQYTGLKDKHGKEIYEGDVLSFFGKKVAIVVFESLGGWCYKWISEPHLTLRSSPEPFFHNINLFEVIGNIYENPELCQ